jgi:hypothetical protein
MNDLGRALPALFSELVHGSPDQTVGTYMLNRGDRGLLHSLDQIPASAASTSTTGGATIAAHADHLRYGLELLNRWAAGEEAPWKNADWTASWHKRAVTTEEWRTIRDDLRREAETWQRHLGSLPELNDAALKWTVGSVAHLAYHLGAIRQIDKAARGPTAEDEREASLASPPDS